MSFTQPLEEGVSFNTAYLECGNFICKRTAMTYRYNGRGKYPLAEVSKHFKSLPDFFLALKGLTNLKKRDIDVTSFCC